MPSGREITPFCFALLLPTEKLSIYFSGSREAAEEWRATAKSMQALCLKMFFPEPGGAGDQRGIDLFKSSANAIVSRETFFEKLEDFAGIAGEFSLQTPKYQKGLISH